MAFPSAYTWAVEALPLLRKFKATLTRVEGIAEPMYVVKGQGGTALLSRVAEERMVPGPNLLHGSASHGRKSESDSRAS